MRQYKIGRMIVYMICAMLTVSAFFANRIALYQFHMLAADYSFAKGTGTPPQKADTSVWFTYGTDKEVDFWTLNETAGSVSIYAKTAGGIVETDMENERPFGADDSGYLIAAAAPQQLDLDGNGTMKTVCDFARADFGSRAYSSVTRSFHSGGIPFELCLEERKKIRVFYQREAVADSRVLVTTSDFQREVFETDAGGYIKNLPIKYIWGGLTVSYEPVAGMVYRMYYAVERYDYFSPHFWKAQIPLLLVLALTAVTIFLIYHIREHSLKKTPAYQIYAREKAGLYGANPVNKKTDSPFLLVRWLFLIAGFFLWTYAGKLTHQEQALNQIAVPVFTCPHNFDQTLEAGCYYLTHLPELFTVRSTGYIAAFIVSLFFFLIVFGRILCGFMCPFGFLQDLLDKFRQLLHIRPITVTDRMNRILQPLKWTWIILFLCFTFTGGDFCNICPNKIFSPALSGYWIDLVLGGILAIPLLAGSFYIKRFWCIMCPMGYLLGIFYKFNIFKLKKDCTACTECGACYASCPMRLKNIYTEREREDVQTVDCLMCGECIHKCPEDKALSMTCFGREIYSSSRDTFLSRYARDRKQDGKSKGKKKGGGNGIER